MKWYQPLVLFVVLFGGYRIRLWTAQKAHARYREGRWRAIPPRQAPRHRGRVPTERSFSWSLFRDPGKEVRIARNSVFPTPAIRARRGAGHRVVDSPPLGGERSTLPTRCHPAPRSAASDRIALAIWRRLTPAMQGHPRIRQVLMPRAARHANR